MKQFFNSSKKTKRLVSSPALWIAAICFVSACASVVRTTNTGRSQADIINQFNTDAGSLITASTGSSGTSFNQVYTTPGVELYFAESSPQNHVMGPVSVVASLDFQSLGINSNMDTASSIRVYFLAVPIDAGGSAALAIDYQGDGDATATAISYSSMSPASMQNGSYQVDLVSADGSQTIRLVSSDIVTNSSNLADVIQLSLYDVTSGSEVFIGKIPTLQGYKLAN